MVLFKIYNIEAHTKTKMMKSMKLKMKKLKNCKKARKK